MPLLPADINARLSHCAPLCSRRTWRPWRHVPDLIFGALLTSAGRMVSSVLRTVGLAQQSTFQT